MIYFLGSHGLVGQFSLRPLEVIYLGCYIMEIGGGMFGCDNDQGALLAFNERGLEQCVGQHCPLKNCPVS